MTCPPTERPDAQPLVAQQAGPRRTGVDVRPFRALMYNQERVPTLSSVLAPPYDVINAADRQLLLDHHRYNCVRLILPRAVPGRPEESRYTQASHLLRCWLCQGVFKELDEPAVFVLRERFELEARWYDRTSFVAAVKLQPYGDESIYPHEVTMGEARRDRLALLEATRTNLSLVMTFFRDRPLQEHQGGQVTQLLQQVCAREPTLRATGPQSVELTLWVVSEPELCAKLTEEMAKRELFIADGHHRYETALAFARKEGALGAHDPQGPGYTLMQCIPMEDPGLLALPTHRLFPAEFGVAAPGFFDGLRKYFHLERVETPGLGLQNLRELMRRRADEHVFGLYDQDRRAYLLSLAVEETLDEIDCPYDHEARRLDVCLFQELIVNRVFGLDFNIVAKDGTLRFCHSFSEAEQRVDSGEISLAFFVNPTPVAAIPATSRRGGVMPPKSTYFFPKVPAGLIFRLIR